MFMGVGFGTGINRASALVRILPVVAVGTAEEIMKIVRVRVGGSSPDVCVIRVDAPKDAQTVSLSV